MINSIKKKAVSFSAIGLLLVSGIGVSTDNAIFTNQNITAMAYSTSTATLSNPTITSEYIMPDKITFTVNKPSNATGIKIYKYNASTKKYTLLKTATSSKLVYNLTGLNANTKYQVKISCYKGSATKDVVKTYTTKKSKVSLNTPIYKQTGNTCMTTSATMLINGEKNAKWNSNTFAQYAWKKGYFTQNLNAGNRNNSAPGEFGKLGMFAPYLVKSVNEYAKSKNQNITAENHFSKIWDTQEKSFNEAQALKEIPNIVSKYLNNNKRCLVVFCSQNNNPKSGHAIVLTGYTYKSGTYTFTYNNPWGSTGIISANNLAKSMVLVTKAEYGALITLK